MIEPEESEDELILTRNRGPSFSKEEIRTLLDLIDKYKCIIQNKSVTSFASQQKDRAWKKITKAFNKHGFKNIRNVDTLRTKWVNLKKVTKKSKFNVLDIDMGNDVTTRVVSIVAQAEDNQGFNEELSESEEEINEHEDTNISNEAELWEHDNDREKEQKRRQRGRTFSEREVKTLLNLVEKHKSIILNKCNSGEVNRRKDAAWKDIWNTYNKQGLECERSIECLKTKWENLKRDARKFTKNEQCAGNDDLMSHTVTLIAQIMDESNIVENVTDSEMNVKEETLNGDDLTMEWDNEDNNRSGDSDEENKDLRHRNRSSVFSPRECALLLNCVKREKRYLSLKGNTQRVRRIRNHAWARIAKTYNKLSSRKKSSKVLHDKFISMQKLSKDVSNNSFKDYFRDNDMKKNDDEKPIKLEVESEDEETGIHSDRVDGKDTDHRYINMDKQETDAIFAEDPLSTVLSSDSGVGCVNSFEDNLVNSMKHKLLNYKMKTEKLKRKRIEDLIKSDNAHRKTLRIESALRLRAARLEVVAAAMKLSPSHPALQFPAEECAAKAYLERYQ